MSEIYLTLHVDENKILEGKEGMTLKEAIALELEWLKNDLNDGLNPGLTIKDVSKDLSFSPSVRHNELADEIAVQTAHYAGLMEAKKELCEMDIAALSDAVQSVIQEYDQASEQYLKEPSKSDLPDAYQIAERILKERFANPELELHSFYYTFGTSSSFPFQKGYVKVNAVDQKAADALFRQAYPDKTPGILNCAWTYNEDTFQKMLERNPDMPADWKVCHNTITQPFPQNKEIVVLTCTHETKYGISSYTSIHPSAKEALSAADDLCEQLREEDPNIYQNFHADFEIQTIDMSQMKDALPQKEQQRTLSGPLDQRIKTAASIKEAANTSQIPSKETEKDR